ncbi:PEP-CTERM sorting domain-containing protein [Roseiconus nitratireducens]|uniref:PEP-CTERM sorting domain-containing protein n=1 Tax=Roseiconus nitratireducens TaxID=2605748 RepID=A0A5M6D0I6_9BACT|nr:PEP-CTERM sorting domain-containing protein [Roseiconus nitratireducens]KAA5539099.1 PEP-CTERM sorting domain-containing protein [Roseiconus nitratireducens]
MRRFTAVLLAALLTATLARPAQAGVMGIMNGDFEAGSGNVFTGWDTFSLPPFIQFLPPAAGVDTNRFVLFNDQSPLETTQLEQTIELTNRSQSLSFDFQFQSSGQTGFFDAPDSFQAGLYDLGGNPLLTSPLLPNVDLPTFLSIDDNGNSASNPGVQFFDTNVPGLRSGWTRVTVDVSAIAPQMAILEFSLFAGNDSLVDSSASLDNVVLTSRAEVIPEPSSMTIFALAIPLLAVGRRRRTRASV